MAYVPHRFFERLSAGEKRIYLLSDQARVIPIPDPVRRALRPKADAIRAALEADQLRAVAKASADLVGALLRGLEVAPVKVIVRARRPRSARSELHGLYTRWPGEEHPPQIEVWMRTAAQQRTVTFRTFFRTLLHEVCHHLDWVLFRWPETFHTKGFFARESHLVRQLARDHASKEKSIPPSEPTLPVARAARKATKKPAKTVKTEQLALAFDPDPSRA